VYAFFQTPQGKTILALGEDYAKQIWDWLISQQPSSVEHCAMLLQSPRCPCPPQLLAAACASPRGRFRATTTPPDISSLPANVQAGLAAAIAAKAANDQAQAALAPLAAAVTSAQQAAAQAQSDAGTAKQNLQAAASQLEADLSAYFQPSA
jgi:hypothetical protein